MWINNKVKVHSVLPCLTFTLLHVCEGVSDLNEAIPETELLDNSIQKGRAQLSVKTRRQRPSRSRYRDSISSTEGDDCLDRKVEVSEMQGAPCKYFRELNDKDVEIITFYMHITASDVISIQRNLKLLILKYFVKFLTLFYC